MTDLSFIVISVGRVFILSSDYQAGDYKPVYWIPRWPWPAGVGTPEPGVHLMVSGYKLGRVFIARKSNA